MTRPVTLSRTSQRDIPCPALLNIRSHYSFLDSLLAPAEAVKRAAEAGYQVVALTDPNLHGMVEFVDAAKRHGLRPVIGAEITLNEMKTNPRHHYLAYVRSEAGFHNLCHLLSLPTLSPHDLDEHREGLWIIDPRSAGLALPEVRYAAPEDHDFYRVVQSIRTLTLLRQSHPEKRRGSFALPTPASLVDIAGMEAVHRTRAALEDEFYLPEWGSLHLPGFTPRDGSTPRALLRHLAESGLRRRYPADWQHHLGQLNEELQIIADVGYEEYFLTVWDLLQECERRGIEWLTRGSAADSLVCYCLGISSLCPFRFELYFRRFLNLDRMKLKKLPDIDLDFPHDRRDEVVDLIFDRFGTTHAALIGGFSTYRARSAIADIAKVFGVPERHIRRLTEALPDIAHSEALTDDPVFQIEQEGSDQRTALFEDEPYRTALRLAARLEGAPRHAKMHPCAVVISRVPIHHLTPTFATPAGRPATHADMDAAERLGLVKLDILAQGGLAVLRDTQASIRRYAPETTLPATPDDLAPWNDSRTWDMICRGDTRGIHHIESPAMTSLHQMCCCRNIDVLIAIVSVIRPGAANSMRKETFALRSQGLAPIEYAHTSLEPVLRTTFGVVAYEEHILQIAEVFANWPPGRSDQLRRALVKQNRAAIDELYHEFNQHARRFGRQPAEIAAVWDLLERFQGYAFCRAHSTAYALEAYHAAWFKCRYPGDFFASILTHGKGFYDRLVYSIEARRHGVEFAAPSINGPLSEYQFCPTDPTEPPRGTIQVPLSGIKGISEALLAQITKTRERHGNFSSLRDFLTRVAADEASVRHLIRCGAFDTLCTSRFEQFWQWRQIIASPNMPGQASLFDDASLVGGTPSADTPANAASPCEPGHVERLRDEWELLGFTVSGHPLELWPEVEWSAYCPVADLPGFVGRRVRVCGLVTTTRIHGQSDGQPMKFMSLCDPTGIVEGEMFAAAYRRWGHATNHSPLLVVSATVTPHSNQNGVTLVIHHAEPWMPRRPA